jgi:hypothetical protein
MTPWRRPDLAHGFTKLLYEGACANESREDRRTSA